MLVSTIILNQAFDLGAAGSSHCLRCGHHSPRALSVGAARKQLVPAGTERLVVACLILKVSPNEIMPLYEDKC